MVGISAGGCQLTATSTHRYVAFRGGREVPAPATSLRPGDDVLTFSNDGTVAIKAVDQIRRFLHGGTVFKITFLPDEPVLALNTDGLLTKGHRAHRPTRRGRTQVQSQVALSIPETYAEWF